MKNIIFILVIIAVISSCTSRTIYKKPENLISKEQMIAIWTDIYIASGARTVKNKRLEKNIKYVPLVYKKYNIDSTRFNESSIYYTSRIDEYEEMFKEVQKRLIEIKNIYSPESTLDSVLRENKQKINRRNVKN